MPGYNPNDNKPDTRQRDATDALGLSAAVMYLDDPANGVYRAATASDLSSGGPAVIASSSTNLTMTGSALPLPTPPAGATWANVQAQGGDIRSRVDGSTPTLTAGQLWYEGEIYSIRSAAEIAACKVIGNSGIVLDITWRG